MTTERRWAKLAWQRARKRAGAAWDLLGSDLRHALVARELIVIFASQETANGDHMRAAASIVLETEDQHDRKTEAIERPSDSSVRAFRGARPRTMTTTLF